MSYYEKLFLELEKNYGVVPEKLPTTDSVYDFLTKTLNLLFPQCRKRALGGASFIEKLENDLNFLIKGFNQEDICENNNIDSGELAKKFISTLPKIQQTLISDANAIYSGDPAAFSITEVILAYPGFYAISVHRIAHEFYKIGLTLLARIISEVSHKETGIDIHPGAKIDSSFCIDHGTGIVIGETSIIEENVKIYQGVTLGGLSVDKSFAKKKRHPTIKKNVVIYANATILGGDTVIGENSIIGGSVWLTSSVDANSKVYYKGEILLK